MAAPMSRRLLREPLVQFLLLGAGLFAVDVWMSGVRGAAPARLEVGVEQVERLAAEFRVVRQRPPTAEELEGLVASFVRDELYQLEARALGLGDDDPIVRRRLRQRLEQSILRVEEATPPDEPQLVAFFDRHREVYRIPPFVTLRQVYFSAERRGAAAAADARSLLPRLSTGGWPADGAEVGDPLPRALPAAPLPPSEVAGLFGDDFAGAVLGLPVGVWSGPIESDLGLHLVFVVERREGRLPTFDEVRYEVEVDWRAERRERVARDFDAELRRRYDVVVRMPETLGEAGEATP